MADALQGSLLRDAASRLVEAEAMAAEAAKIRAAALADIVRAASTPPPPEPPPGAGVKGAPDLITMKEACAISRLSRQNLGGRTRGMSWRYEHPGRTMFERASFLRWLDQHRAK